MKKNISINISGIIFHIEEDGYDKLKHYLASIARYFSNYEDSTEIIADIESRIAELFLARLGDHKQVITLEDVDDLMTTMGTVADFEAAEEQYTDSTTAHQTAYGSSSSTGYSSTGTGFAETEAPPTDERKPRKLYRDLDRKILGGVAAGLAHYFSIDPLWVRLLFLATFFDVFYVVSVSGVAVVAYIVLWAITPGSHHLGEGSQYKRLYRDPEGRVLGGVGAGLAAYFGIDVTLVRLLFILGIFLGGSGIIVYLILWFIAPEAKTLTDRMQMEGEPVTLSNIEKKIKQGLNLDQDEEENLLTKILLFPFRLLAMLLDSLGGPAGTVGHFLGQVLRVVSGLGMLLLGALVVVALFIVGAALFGITFAPAQVRMGGIPMEVVRNSYPLPGLIASMLVVGVPFLVLSAAGASQLVRRRIMSRTFALTVFGLWLLGLVGVAFTLPNFLRSFNTEADLRTEELIAMPDSLLTLGLDANANHLENDFTELTVRGYEGQQLKLVRIIQAHGQTREDAIQNAQMIDYQFIKPEKKPLLAFAPGFVFKPQAKFRVQHLKLELYVPYGKPFVMQPDLADILRGTLFPFGYSARDLGDSVRWVYNEKGLTCLNCQTAQTERGRTFDRDQMQGFVKEFKDFKDFNRLSISRNFEVEIRRGDQFEIVLEGEKSDVVKVDVTQEGSELRITHQGRGLVGNELRLYIALPELAALAADGSSSLSVEGFKGPKMEVALSGNIDLDADLETDDLTVAMDGDCSLDLRGRGQKLTAVLSGDSDLAAFEFEADDLTVTAKGSSQAQVLARRQITVASTGDSQVTYKGRPKVVNGAGNFQADEE
ncbi:MAG: PspC domain-containing protein [Bernardetiaceae bacterium]|jgi:phage shock protein PspC (stress-responsive transcriptional regulator)|nr:PspC domain-containing protein [Bernardetiaceae bacterium]